MVIDRQQIRYITLRKQIGTQAQVADLLAVTARTVQRRERGAMPITREAWLAIEMLSASLYAPGAIRLTPRRTSATSQVISRPAIT